MSAKYIISAIFLAMLAFPSLASAQSLDPYYTRLSEYNRLQPRQNPSWNNLAQVQKNSIVDSKNKVIGNVNDILLGQNGAVETLNVDLNRLQLGQTMLNYRDMRIRSGSGSYILGFDSAQIRDNYASIMANIDTAAGEDANTMSARTLKGAAVEAHDGRVIGKVDDIFFSSRADRADALLVNVNFRSIRSKLVAIPFSSVDFTPVGNTLKVKLADNQADTILKFAENK